MTKEATLRALRSPFAPLGSEVLATLVERGQMSWRVVASEFLGPSNIFDKLPKEKWVRSSNRTVIKDE